MRGPFNFERSRWFCSCLFLFFCLEFIPLPAKFLLPPSHAFAAETGDKPLRQADSELLAEANQLNSTLSH